jgi:DNA repair protein RadC
MMICFVSEKTPEESFYTNTSERIENTIISTPSDVFNHLKDFLSNKKQEYFIVLSLDGKNAVISTRIASIGILNMSLVHPREVFKDAILDSASRIIAIHNHPSGACEASQMDISITRQLTQAGEIIGIPLVDHIIISSEGFISMKDRGLL